jgi:hypothetical protein
MGFVGRASSTANGAYKIFGDEYKRFSNQYFNPVEVIITVVMVITCTGACMYSGKLTTV